MQRRAFVKSLAASLTSVGLLAEQAQAFGGELEKFHTDVGDAASDQALWDRVRGEFMLADDLVHLNCGSVGATPRMVVDAVSGYLRQFEGNPVGNSFNGHTEMATKAAEFIGADPDEIHITRNTTEGMNMIAEGLELGPGDQILTSNHEHGGGMICWQHLARRRGVEVVCLPLPTPVQSADQILQLVEDHITDRTRLCSFMHIDTITGLRMPLAAIAEITRRRDILLVCDGAQGPGMVDVDVKTLGVDAYASSSHKWMLAPKGSGLLYIRRAVQDRIRPVDLYATRNAQRPAGSYTDYGKPGYSASVGTRSIPIVLGHGLAMDFHNALGRDRIEQRCRQLSDYARARLRTIPGLQLLTPEQPALSSGMVSFGVAGGRNGEVRRRLFDEHNIVVKGAQGTYAFVEQGGAKSHNFNALRFSTHIFNNEAEIDRTADLIEAILAS
ncbi:MAG: aminotransferase class V-fold PLP-dependent enzyme [Candidatus Latescibacteria bacterium]|nr:aminotransferase class V-fold PLP-dependent enzyme [Candidatus Latescibacterota bacterium]